MGPSWLFRPAMFRPSTCCDKRVGFVDEKKYIPRCEKLPFSSLPSLATALSSLGPLCKCWKNGTLGDFVGNEDPEPLFQSCSGWFFSQRVWSHFDSVQLATKVFCCSKSNAVLSFSWLRLGYGNFENSSYQKMHFAEVERVEVHHTSGYLGAPGSM